MVLSISKSNCTLEGCSTAYKKKTIEILVCFGRLPSQYPCGRRWDS